MEIKWFAICLNPKNLNVGPARPESSAVLPITFANLEVTESVAGRVQIVPLFESEIKASAYLEQMKNAAWSGELEEPDFWIHGKIAPVNLRISF